MSEVLKDIPDTPAISKQLSRDFVTSLVTVIPSCRAMSEITVRQMDDLQEKFGKDGSLMPFFPTNHTKWARVFFYSTDFGCQLRLAEEVSRVCNGTTELRELGSL